MTLTEAAAYIKKGSRYALIGIIGIVILWMVIMFTISTFQKLFPAKEVPTLAYGQLPKPTIPTTNTSKNISFVLDTIDGKLPTLKSVLPVYRFDPQTSGLLNSDQSKTVAASFGFSNPPNIINSDTYQYTDTHNPGQILTYNIVSKNFSLVSDFSNPATPKTPSNRPFDDLITSSRSLLKSHDLLAPDLIQSNATATPVKISGTSTIRAASISDANYVRIDIFRDGVGSYPIVGPNKNEALINLLMSNSSGNGLVSLNYTYWKFQPENYATYPTLPVSQAFDQLKSGTASLIYPLSINFTEVRIQNISVAYFEDARFQPYLQPIYLFDGVAIPKGGSEINVRFYLPAIDTRYFVQ